jgi:hypothetical protein
MALDDTILFFVNNDGYGFLEVVDRESLLMVENEYHELIHTCKKLQAVEFSYHAIKVMITHPKKRYQRQG